MIEIKIEDKKYLLNTNKSVDYAFKVIDNYLVFEYKGEFLASYNIEDIKDIAKNQTIAENFNIDFIETEEEIKKFMKELKCCCYEFLEKIDIKDSSKGVISLHYDTIIFYAAGEAVIKIYI